MQVSQALNPRRIARTLVTVFALSFIQTVVPPVVSPIISAPKAEAVTGTVTASSGGSGSTIQIPSGVFSVTFTAVGGAGGKGGDDVNIGLSGTTAGRTIITIAVTPGDVIGLYPGNAGAAAGACASAAPGGAGGTDTFPGGAYSINGTYFTAMNFAGGTGGNAGAGGCSGAGGGAGAASIATVNSEIVAIAGGAGGGGGTGSGNNTAQPWNGTRQNNGTSFTGEAGTTVGTCTGSYLDSDGGGGGGGGGGYYGGKGGLAPMRTAECAGFSGSPGGNYVASRSTSVTNDLIAHSSNGYVTYDYNVAATTTCSKSTTTVDIYTVESISYTGECTWTVPSNVNNVDFFAVGGGGGGGGDAGSGGGGGAALLRMAVPVTPSSTVTLKVGGGGAGGSWGYSWGPIAGEATTLTLASGTVFTANGGSAGTSGPNSGSGAGGTAVNGGFTGGAGGTSPSCFNVGGAGKTGSSNYFLGTLNSYGGGGGGGACPNGAATVAAAGANGGGSGGYAVSSSLNAPGGNATAGTGSGGGGGLATGTGLKINGGKGASGVIIIRYATDAANAFPVSLASSVAARWNPNGLQVLDSAREGWIDSSGTNASVASGNISGNPTIGTRGTTDGASSTSSSKSLLSVSGTPTDNITLVDLPSNYTMFNIARYRTTGSKGRLITTNTGNWLSGHYNGNAGLTHHNYWLTPEATNVSNLNGWLLSTDQLKLYRANGLDVSYVSGTNQNAQSTSTGFGVNNSNYAQKSDFDVADILIFNRQLNNGEIRMMEQYLARIYGLTLNSQSYNSAETDTAVTLDATQELTSPHGYGGAINDTFTIEAWVNPATYCLTGLCQFVVRENVFLLGMHVGTLRFALQGKVVGGWAWTDTGVKIPANEWHHFTMVKQFTGDAAGSLLLYMDGQLIYTQSGSPYVSGTYYNSTSSSYAINDNDDQSIYVGSRYISDQRLVGQIDEVKIWKTSRTRAQIQSDMHSNDTMSATLQYYWDFNRAVGTNTVRIPNLAYYGNSRADLSIAGTPTYTDVKIESTYGPYRAIKFPRSYITQNNGWSVPESVTALSLLVVGGGGGGAGAFTGDLNAGGGGGGGGGVFAAATAVNVSNERKIKITVGAGGPGGLASAAREGASGFTGQTSYFGTLSAGGGGGGGYVASSTSVNGLDGTSAGGGGGASNYNAAYNSGAGGTSQPTLFGGETWQGFDGGSGAVYVLNSSATGDAGPGGGTLSASRLSPGNGVSSNLSGTATTYGRGGTARGATGYSFAEVPANFGTGGAGQFGTSAPGGRGSAGVIWVRYLAASKPSFTPPTNAYLNVGMTETFTTNVAQDSATAWMTRNFRWESTTAGANGNFSTIKQGTGAANAAFSWVPSDTSTSGNQYLYRVVVTDTDQAGLTYQDTSSAVFAVINGALRMTGTSTSISKTINIARNETFTISSGTPTYRYTLSPVIPGVTIDTSTAGLAILKISDTASVGTYFETLTVTDSVSATLSIPITINISAPPALLAVGEIVKNNQVLNLDAGNRASLAATDAAATTSVTWNDLSGAKKNGSTSNTVNGTTCNAPTYSTDFGGILNFAAAGSTCYNTPYLGSQFTTGYTIEAWFKTGTATIANGYQVISQQYNTAYEQISLVIGDLDRNNGNIYVGFHDGAWQFMPVGFIPVKDQWNHVVGTYNGETMTTYLNGIALGTKFYKTSGGLVNTKPLLIGKRWDSTYYFTGSIGEVRAYTRDLSAAEVLQNYNATKYRYESSNQTIVKPSQKYGTLNIETFTVTSGGETETISFAAGNVQGIAWDTSSTPGQIKLSVQESLTPGTYYDTITVTDNFGQSTTLPIRFTVTKADTITVYVDTPTALNYTGNRANFTQTLKATGAVGQERGARFSATVKFKPGGTTCATGGYCRVGDIGPGGGIVFIDTSTASSDGRIYEVAPQNWSGSDDLSTVATYCSNNSSSIGASQQGIGWGETNTNLAKASCLGGAVGKVNSFNLSNTTGYSDWFIPSRNEGIELAKYPAQTGLLNIGSNWTVGNSGYWSSTESNTTTMYSIGHAGATFNGTSLMIKSDATKNMVRPVRAFKSCWSIDTCTALATTETPTSAGVYMMTPSALTNITDLNARYSSVQYAPSPLTINRIAQRNQTLPIVNLLYPETFTVYVTGGDGNGAVTYSAVNGTASGCAFDYKKLYTTSLGTCAVTVVKAGDRNYLPDTVTTGIYFYAFVMNQPTPAVGSGPNIALTGETAIYRNTSAIPTITGLSVDTAIAGLTQIIIYGTGFDDTIASRFLVKFWRGVEATTYSINGLDTEITVIVPTGAETGKVIVETANGRAISQGTLTIVSQQSGMG